MLNFLKIFTLAPTQVRDDPSSRLEGLEEDEEITADKHKHNCDSLSQAVSYGYRLGEKEYEDEELAEKEEYKVCEVKCNLFRSTSTNLKSSLI